MPHLSSLTFADGNKRSRPLVDMYDVDDTLRHRSKHRNKNKGDAVVESYLMLCQHTFEEHEAV